ncbi:MAG TPA: type II secretion system protein N [Marinobacter sp.]|nr:type II secretion system protein N [Marinobacter sp.]
MLLNNQRLPLILTLVAGAAMLGTTAWQGFSFWSGESDQAVDASVSAEGRAFPAEVKVPSVSLASIDLFGSPSLTENNQVVDTENLPETNLRLYLRGVMAAEGEFPGSALIEDSKNKTEAYLVGNELPGNAILRSVFPNRVIIDRQGKLENLFFPESDDRSGVSFAAESESIPEPQIVSEPSSVLPTPAPATPGEEGRREEIRKRLEQLRERLRTNN